MEHPPLKPIQIQQPTLNDLRKICQDYLDFLDGDDYHDDNDYKHYIFEKAMEAMFGNEVWKYINSK
jgi:hypothetical protein